MSIKVGDKVVLKEEIYNSFDPSFIFKDIFNRENIFTVKSISDSAICDFVETKYVLPETCLEVLKPKQEKTNVIKRSQGCSNNIITYNVNDKIISFDVKGKIHLTTLLKILLHETKLYNYKYERISPFKFKREYVSEDTQHKWWIEFIDIKSFENISQEIIRCDKNMAFEGSCNIFIPDFLELCVERNLLQRVNDGYRLIKKIDNVMEYCEYLKGRPSINELKSKGYIIPNQYVKLIEKEEYSLKHK